MEEKIIKDNELENVSGGAANGAAYYVVVKGDTLSHIAKRFGTTVAKLVQLNPQIKNPDRIYVGDTIRIA